MTYPFTMLCTVAYKYWSLERNKASSIFSPGSACNFFVAQICDYAIVMTVILLTLGDFGLRIPLFGCIRCLIDIAKGGESSEESGSGNVCGFAGCGFERGCCGSGCD